MPNFITGGAHAIQDETAALAAQPILNFEGAGVAVTNDNPNQATVVTVPGTDGTSPVTTKGDLYGYGAIDARIPVGVDGQMLYADSLEVLGLKWDDAPPGVTDELAKISATDTTSDFLQAKIAQGANITLTVLSPGGDEQLEIAAPTPFASPMTTKGDVFTFDTGDQRLGVGTDGQILVANSAAGTGLNWVDAVSTLPLTTKGDLLVYTTTPTRLGVGADGQYLVADSIQAEGVAWKTLVQPATKGDILSNNGTIVANMGIGADGEYIIADSASPMGMKWATGQLTDELAKVTTNDTTPSFLDTKIQAGNNITLNVLNPGADERLEIVSTAGGGSPLTTKGDVYVFGLSDTRLPVGTNGQVLTADSAETTGLKWTTGGGSSPLTTKGDLYSFSTVDARIGVGTNGQVLSAASGEVTGLLWVDVFSSPLTTAGDLLVNNGGTDIRLGVGTDGFVLSANSGQPSGLEWTAAGGAAPVDSVFTRTGAVVGTNTDYAGVSGWQVDSVQYLVAAAPAHSEGLVFYDNSTDALSYYNDISDVTVSIGREVLLKVRNTTGSTILNGKAVTVSGAQANLPTIILALADGTGGARAIGLTTHDIENNTNGYVALVGTVSDINTSAFSEGDFLYVSSTVAGDLVNVAPDFPVLVGQVTISHVSNGQVTVYTRAGDHAENVIYDNVTSGLTATVVQDAIDELVGGSVTEIANGNSSVTTNIDWTAGKFQTITLNDSPTFTFTNPAANAVGWYQLRTVKDNNATPRTVTWPTPMLWSGFILGTTSTANEEYVIRFYWTGTKFLASSTAKYETV